MGQEATAWRVRWPSFRRWLSGAEPRREAEKNRLGAGADQGRGQVQIRVVGSTVYVVAEAHGPLPGHVQDTPAAEAYAFLVFLRHAGEGPHSYSTDCSWVADSFAAGPEACTQPQHVHAEIWREIWRLIDDILGVKASR